MALRRLYLIIFFLFFAFPVQADDYAQTSFANLMRTMVRFNAIDLKEDALIDEYAMVTDCELVQYFYPDDFKWNQVRAAIRKSVSLNIATFPTEYNYDSKVQFSRYDFKLRSFRFTDRATIRNVNTFLLLDDGNFQCGKYDLKYIPKVIRAVLDVPISVGGLPFDEASANALLQRMDNNGNTDHVVYARFRLRVVNVDALRKYVTFGDKLYYRQGDKSSGQDIRFDTRLDAIDFYEDQDMTKLIYNYRP